MDNNILQFYRVIENYFKLNENTQPNVKFQIAPKYECKINFSGNEMTAFLSVKINSDISRAPTPFDLNATMVGKFTLSDALAADKRGQVIYAVQTLFPFLRSFVSTVTVNCNLPVFVLPMFDVEAMADSISEATAPMADGESGLN